MGLVPAGADEYVAALGAMARAIRPDSPSALLSQLQALLTPPGVTVRAILMHFIH
jgi:hypothetical protein